MAHRLSDSIELNNPRGSGEGYGRTISHEGSDDELLEAWFHGARLNSVLLGVHFPSYRIRGLYAAPREKGALRPY